VARSILTMIVKSIVTRQRRRCSGRITQRGCITRWLMQSRCALLGNMQSSGDF